MHNLMNIHDVTGERPFECDICQKRFTLKHSMMRHRKKHAGAPPRSFDDDEDSIHGEDRGKLHCFNHATISLAKA